jgi:large subunit ribosomal protein L5
MTETQDKTQAAPARLKQRYREEILPALKTEFEFANVMMVPGLTKIVVNMGVGEAARDSKLIEGAIKDLTAITGQKPQVTKARKSIAQFKLREGMPIGAHVTLRGDRMWEFLDRLLSLALPRIRDFRGLSPKQFDGRGNYTFGLTEQVMFHEIDQDRIDRRAVWTSRSSPPPPTTTRVGRCSSSSASRSRRTDMAKTALKGQGRPQAEVRCPRATPAASAAVARRPSTASSACAGSACGRWPPRRAPGVTKSSGNHSHR